jgi:hypothetical protein
MVTFSSCMTCYNFNSCAHVFNYLEGYMWKWFQVLDCHAYADVHTCDTDRYCLCSEEFLVCKKYGSLDSRSSTTPTPILVLTV